MLHEAVKVVELVEDRKVHCVPTDNSMKEELYEVGDRLAEKALTGGANVVLSALAATQIVSGYGDRGASKHFAKEKDDKLVSDHVLELGRQFRHAVPE